MDYMVCPLRKTQFEIKDFWTASERCTYCGSITPKAFFDLVNEGYSVRADKFSKTFTFTGDKQNYKFYYEHLNQSDRILLSEMYRDKRITLIS